jgi:hypothetical protein
MFDRPNDLLHWSRCLAVDYLFLLENQCGVAREASDSGWGAIAYKLQDEDDATAEQREIYRSKLERALEEALVASRRQLEQKNRECQAAMKISERMTKEVTYMRSLHSTMIEEQLAQVQLLNNKLQEEQHQQNAMRSEINTLTYVFLIFAFMLVYVIQLISQAIKMLTPPLDCVCVTVI